MDQRKSLQQLFDTLPQIGRVEWIGLRPARRKALVLPDTCVADAEQGLVGDRYAGRSGKRQVTLVQWEHLAVIASVLQIATLDPALLRRNIAVSGLNLLSLKDKHFKIGNSVFEFTGLCHPCSFMETTFGAGGYNAVRGHGGITARVIRSGEIALNDSVTVAL